MISPGVIDVAVLDNQQIVDVKGGLHTSRQDDDVSAAVDHRKLFVQDELRIQKNDVVADQNGEEEKTDDPCDDFKHLFHRR